MSHFRCNPGTGWGKVVMSTPRMGVKVEFMLPQVLLSISPAPCHMTSTGSVLLWCSRSTWGEGGQGGGRVLLWCSRST